MADELTAKAGEGTPTSQAPAAGATAAPKVEFTPEQQAKVDEIVKRAQKDWDKSNAPLREQSAAYQKLLEEKKAKEDAEKSELQKLQDQIAALAPAAERVKNLEEKFKTLLDTRIQQIPEDRRGLIPEGLTAEASLEYIEKNAKFFLGVSAPTAPPAGPGVTNPISGPPNALREEAASRVVLLFGEQVRKDEKRFTALVDQMVEDLEKRKASR